jgi:hypothetical protein
MQSQLIWQVVSETAAEVAAMAEPGALLVVAAVDLAAATLGRVVLVELPASEREAEPGATVELSP